MQTQINITSRVGVLAAIVTLEKYNISYVENDRGILADMDPETAWNLSLI